MYLVVKMNENNDDQIVSALLTIQDHSRHSLEASSLYRTTLKDNIDEYTIKRYCFQYLPSIPLV